MDKTTKELRARLRECLVRWLESDFRLYRGFMGEVSAAEVAFIEGREIPTDAPSHSDMDGIARVFLTSLSDDDEIGLLSAQIGERRPLNRTLVSLVGEEPSETWVVCRPGLSTPSLPQEIRSMKLLMDIMAEAIVPEWLDYLSEDASPVAQAPKLGKQARAVLELLYREKAFDEAHACNLTKRAPTQLRYESAKSPDTKDKYAKNGAAELKRLRLSEAVPNVGTWLTSEGRALAESLFGQKPR